MAETTPKIVGMMVVGPNERWLAPVLQQRMRLVDDMVIVGNNTDEKTEALIKRYDFWFYRDDREWGKHQNHIKNDLLARVAKLRPDWVLPADADELYDSALTRQELNALAETKALGFYFAIINLWGDTEHYRHDASFWNIRFWKLQPELGMTFERKPLHCGWAPPYVYKHGWHAPFMVKHYGLMLPEERKKRIKRYEKYDPGANFKGREYYDKLADNKGFIRPFNEEDMHRRVAEDVRTNFIHEVKNVPQVSA